MDKIAVGVQLNQEWIDKFKVLNECAMKAAQELEESTDALNQHLENKQEMVTIIRD